MKEVIDKCFQEVKLEGCVNADRDRRGTGLSLCFHDKISGKSVYDGVTVGSCEESVVFRLPYERVISSENSPESSPDVLPEMSPVSISETGAAGSSVNSPASSPDASPESISPNEGCFAVEHLDGFVLQHPKHLMRPVLWANGFCATPNHAI